MSLTPLVVVLVEPRSGAGDGKGLAEIHTANSL